MAIEGSCFDSFFKLFLIELWMMQIGLTSEAVTAVRLKRPGNKEEICNQIQPDVYQFC